MKFLNQAVALTLMSLSATEARKSFNKKDFADAVKAGKIDQRQLLRNAVPVDESVRRQLEEDVDYSDGNYDGYARVDLYPSYKIQFNSCLSLETQNSNLLLEDLIQYTKSGQLVSIRNYILFDVCDGDDCDQQTWMVDLATFIEAVVAFGPNRASLVCEACQTYGEEVCGKTYYYYQADGNGEAQDGERKLQDVDYQLFDESMCSECEEHECWYDDEGDQEEDFASIENWIASIAECQATGVQWNNLDTYAGWMCNADGSGIEIGIFLDETCRMYEKTLQFSNIMSDDDYQYFYQSQDVLPFMFNDIVECRDLDYVQYVDQDTLDAIEGNSGNNAYNNYNNGYGNGYASVGEPCQALFWNSFVPRSMSDCGTTKTWTSAELAALQADDDGAGYDSQTMYEYVQNQGQQMVSNSYGQDASWYTYDLSSLDVMDGATVCEGVRAKWEAAGSVTAATESSNIQNAYAANNSTGSFWKWSNGNTESSPNTSTRLFPSRNGNSFWQKADKNLSPLEICWIIIGSIAATAVFMHVTRKQVLKRRLRKQEPEKEVYVRTDDKGSPLILS
eukprot:Nitzschia sp. Nitz4//scaffold15_size197535//110886//112657//NITZ4_001587-RA/size197535-augustus-gene-0.212-mRNA-1//1//CDS//3329537742//2082//frame0